MKSELVSVIVPIYNVEQYLDKCVESILSQTYSHFELILVDDGSTDHSRVICDEWKKRDDRVRVIHKENGGLSDARNVGIDASNGDWLLFVDGDDFISANAIEKMYNAANEYDCEIAVCNMVRIYDDGSTEPFYHPVDKTTVLKASDRFETLKQPSVCNKLFSVSLFQNVRFPKGKYFEDTFVYHALVYQAQNVVMTGQDGYYYLSRRESILGQMKYSDRYFDMIEAMYMRMTFLLEHDVDQYVTEACLSMYAVVSNAEKNLKRTSENSDEYKQMRLWYKEAYKKLMKSADVGLKQKIRSSILRFIPGLHSKMF